jgi:cystathionine beta-synthase
MIENGFLDSASRRYTVAELLAERPSAPILFVHPDQLAEDAVILMREHGVSQIPVVEEDQVVGCVRELTLARLLYGRMDPKQVPVREVMARAMPVVSELVDLDEVYRLLSAGNTGVMVRRSGRIGAIVTQIDLIDFWDRHVEPAPANAAP